MGVDAVYLLNEKKQIRRVIVWGIYELIHDEATYELDAEIASEYVARPGEFLAFFDVDAHLRYFEINTAEKDERRGVTTITATDAAVDELAHLIVPEIRLTGVKAKDAAQAAVSGSGWKLGSVTDSAKKSDLSAYRDTRWKALRDIAARYNVRVTPYFMIEDGEIIGKYVDVVEKTNVFRGRLLEGTNGGAQIYVTRSGAPITRMYGVGKATGTEDPPACVSFADIEWSKANGDPADKPKGQAYIEDADASALYGEGREDVFTDKYIEDPHELLEETWAELQKRKKPEISGTATASDMEHIPGYEHKIVRMYDLVWVRTKDGEDLRAVVINVKRNYLRRGLTKFTIGEEKEDGQLSESLVKRVASLSSTSKSLGRSSSAGSNRYIETKQLIQLNADTIQMNARLIEANAEEILLTASNLEAYKTGTAEALNEVGIRMNSYEAELLLYAKQTAVDELGEEVNEVYIRLDAAEDEIELKADKIALKGYVTADEFSTLEADLAKVTSGTVQASHLYTQNLTATNTVRLAGHTCEWKSATFLTSNTTLTVYATGGTVTDVTLNKKTATIDYLGT